MTYKSLLFVASIPLLTFSQEKKGISVGEPPPDHSPAAELATFKVLDGFEVNLFASEEDGIPNPIAIRWDERGRLWVLQTSVYPQPTPTEVTDDKIIILEDSDKDGKADKRKVFAGGLAQPMGMELAPNAGTKGHSVYVGEGEKLWLFYDDDGDDEVDRREVVLSGFGTGDTHQNINSFIWAPDGSLVMHQGLHCYSKVVTAWGVVKLYGAGFWRYRPKSGRLEAYPTGMPLNPWGTAFTDVGEPIMVAGAAGMYWSRPMEVSTSETDVRGGNDNAKDSQVHGIPHFLLERFQLPYGGQCIKTEGLTKFCGVDISGNPHWPDNMQGEVISGGFFENKVYRHLLRPDPEFSSGIEAVDQEPLISSNSVAFRPIDIRFGPEGALYIADWYDPIIGHYQASFRHPNRDRAHGRIWRVTAKGRAFDQGTGRWAAYQKHRAMLSSLPEPNQNSYQVEANKVTSDSARERLLGVLAAARLGDIRTALRVLDKPMDSYIERALWLAVHATTKTWKPLREEFLAAMAPQHIAFLLRKEGSAEVKAQAQAILASPSVIASIKDGLTIGLAKEDKSTAGLTPAESSRLKQAARNAAGLHELATSRTATGKLRTAALGKLAIVDPAGAANVVRSGLDGTASLEGMKDLLAPLLVVDAAAKSFSDSLKAKACSADAAKLILRVLTSTGRSDVALTSVLTGILGATNQVPSYSADWVAALAAEVKSNGKPDAGKAVFASTLTNCTACHAISKKGGTIGPELDAVGRGVPVELLIEAVVWPNRQIKEGYIATTVTTGDGRTLTGYKISDTNGELQLRDFTTSTIHQLKVGEIKSRTDSGSLMPEGLVAMMTREELRDLIAYLTTLGR